MQFKNLKFLKNILINKLYLKLKYCYLFNITNYKIKFSIINKSSINY